MKAKPLIFIGVFLLLISGPVNATPPRYVHEADTNYDGCVDLSEIVAYVERWQNGEITIQAVVSGVEFWQRGCNVPYGLLGDVNDDKLVNSADALLIARYLNGLKNFNDFEMGVADVNADGRITHMDSSLIMLYGVQIITELPALPGLYGDANLDGNVTSLDAQRIDTYILNNELNAVVGLANADVNGDGLVTEIDSRLVLQYVVQLVTQLPVTPTLYGDVNMDGTVTSTDALLIDTYVKQNKFTNITNFANADLNGDGLVTGLDADVVLAFEVGLVTNIPIQATLYGDVDGNQVVDSLDAQRILAFLNTSSTLSIKDFANSDVNMDGEITQNDANLILQFDANLLEVLPVCPEFGCRFRPEFTVRNVNDVTQIISLNKGWNYFSLNVKPMSLDIEILLKALVDDGSLIIVKNNAGDVYRPSYGINNIGQISLEEGYQVKVTQDAQLIVHGEKLTLPFNIKLKSGWNIMSYPAQNPKEAVIVLSDLINNNVLVKVLDDAGNSIVYLPEIGWIDYIGNFEPGEGYSINVNQSAILTIQ